ncbi:ribonuclease domain-containing protein [Amycolatopsis sp. NPDC005003]
MTNYRSRLAAVLLALLATLFAGVTTAASPAVAAQNACGNLAGFSHTTLSALPPEATTTYHLIQTNGPFPYPKNDGVVFDNREGVLPACASGYYHEYTVPTPGSSTRGTRRIVTGSAGEYFYTGDHYATFKVIDIGGGTTHACGDLSGLAKIGYSQLSSAARTVVDNVRNGTSAGTTYENREGVLPACASGYYKLFAVGTSDRVISGKAGELAYTPDRYATFKRIDLNS